MTFKLANNMNRTSRETVSHNMSERDILCISSAAFFFAFHSSLHYRHAESVVIGSRPALGTVRGNWANMTRDFGIETFVDMSITKDASCGARLVQVELRRETIKRRNSQLVDTIDPRYSKSQSSRQATVTDNGRACFIRFG